MQSSGRIWQCRFFAWDVEILNQSPIGVEDMVRDDKGRSGMTGVRGFGWYDREQHAYAKRGVDGTRQ